MMSFNPVFHDHTLALAESEQTLMEKITEIATSILFTNWIKEKEFELAEFRGPVIVDL